MQILGKCLSLPHEIIFMKGTWQGFYKYNNKTVQQLMGFDKTNFTLIIKIVNGIAFEGTVIDDITTGGMEGEGKITGTLKGNKITFKKFMPRESVLLDVQGNRRQTEKPHNILYYKGILSRDGHEITGTWKFKNKLTFLFGIIPFVYCPGSGSWGMKFVN